VNGQASTPEQVGDIAIKHTNNVPVRVADIGGVGPAVEPVYTVVTADGKPALLVSVTRQPNSNTVDVADEVHAEMASRCGRSTINRTSSTRRSRACAMRLSSGCSSPL
jgi:multidrug efflux pump subunit AcrB